MPNRDVIVMAASAGGIEALQTVLAGLPSDLPASVLVVLHMPPSGGHSLPSILDRATDLTVERAKDGAPLAHGRVYCCVADHHLLVGDGHLHVRRGPRENGHRPAADPLFRSAAGYCGPRAIGVVLSGTLSDGTSGLAAIRRQGGLAVVQDPADALYDGMPSNALEYVGADHVAPAATMGSLLAELAGQDAPRGEQPLSEGLAKEVALLEGDDEAVEGSHVGTPSPWPCPDCSGVLWAIDEEPMLRFRCRVGHAWSAESLLHEQAQGVEGAMWVALRALEDRVALGTTLAERAEGAGHTITAKRFRADLLDMRRSVTILRRLLERDGDEEGESEQQEARGG